MSFFVVGLMLLACDGSDQERTVRTRSPAPHEAQPKSPTAVQSATPQEALEDDGFHDLLSRPRTDETTGQLGAPALASAVERSNTASFAAWRAFAEKGSFVVAPHSIRSALALVYLASPEGEGRSSLRSGFLYPERDEDMDIRLLDSAVRATAEARFESASSVWVARQRDLKPAYLDAVSRILPAEVHSIDFASEPRRAQRMINAWVSDRTRGKIPHILEESVITTETRAALVNAVHFAAKWSSPFDRALTAPKPFRTLQGKVVEAPTMVGATCDAVFTADYQAAFADYAGTSVSFVVVVPKRWHRFLWDTFAFRRVWAALAKSSRTQLELPRFTLRSRKELQPVLDHLDLHLGDPRLLAGMLTSGEGFSIDVAIHEAFIQVDETSTEAAAATAITNVSISDHSRPPVFRVDRPFYFLLVERTTGLVLFMGQMTGPTALGAQ